MPRLVSPEMAARFGSARDRLNAAIRENDGEEVAKRAAVMIRGWQALDKAATEAGCEALPLRTVGVKHEGRSYVVAWDRADAHKAATLADDPERVVTVHELLVAWEAMRDRMNGETVADVKRAAAGGGFAPRKASAKAVPPAMAAATPRIGRSSAPAARIARR